MAETNDGKEKVFATVDDQGRVEVVDAEILDLISGGNHLAPIDQGKFPQNNGNCPCAHID